MPFNDGVTIAFKVIEENPGHTKVRMYIGRNPGARAMSGTLTLRTDELEELVTFRGWQRLEDA